VPRVRNCLTGHNISERAAKIIALSWRSSTSKQYATYINKWTSYCQLRNLDPDQPKVEDALDFLAELFEQGLGYSAINTARSALSCLHAAQGQPPIGQHPLVYRFVRGVFNQRPTLPRYSTTWDVATVMDFIANSPNDSLKIRTELLTMLLAILTGYRIQSLQALTVTADSVTLREDGCTLQVQALTKTTRPGHHTGPLTFRCYSDEKLCLVCRLRDYIAETETVRDAGKHLLLSYIKPHRPVSRDTIGRWIRSTLHDAGIDISVYKPHSTRSAAASAAARGGAPIDAIMSRIGWTNARTFAQFYNKPLGDPQSSLQEYIAPDSEHTTSGTMR
jgi:integrase